MGPMLAWWQRAASYVVGWKSCKGLEGGLLAGVWQHLSSWPLCISPACCAVVSFFVLPVRARDMLERHMASTLIKMGDLAVWLVGQACVPPAPGSTPRSGDMPGRSGTDNQ